MLIYKKKRKFFIGRTDGQTHVQLKTIVRNLTKKKSLFKRIFYKKQQEIKTNVMLLKLGSHVLWVNRIIIVL